MAAKRNKDLPAPVLTGQPVPPAQSPAIAGRAAATQPAAAPAPPWQECLDDVTLPPGGGSWQPPAEPEECDPPYLSQGTRDLRLDLLRGYFVIAMIIDHVRGDSPLYAFTGGNRFFTSAAEGFILISGLVTGLVYSRAIQREGMGPGLLKVIARAAILYLVTVGMTLLLLPISEILYLPWAQGVDLSDPLGLVISILTLHRTYYLIDVMMLYTILFLFAPMAFVLLDQRSARPVLAASVLLWGLWQVYPQYASLPWSIEGNYLFNFSAWQILFFGGMLLGYKHKSMPVFNHRQTRIALAATGVAFALLIVSYLFVEAPAGLVIFPSGITMSSPLYHDVRLWLQNYVFAKVDLRPGRLLASAITFSFLFFFVTVYWKKVQRFAGWLLMPLGQHALYAYSAHIVVVTIIAIAMAPIDVPASSTKLLNLVIQVASVLVIWFCIRRQFLAPNDRTRRLWYAAPAAFALAVVFVLYWFPSPSHPALAAAATPDAAIAQDQTPRRFGTPLPKSAVTSKPATAAGTPAPAAAAAAAQGTATPTVVGKPVEQPESPDRLAAYQQNILGHLQERWFYSAELDTVMPYVIYTPPDYRTASRRYPVLYMLHGRGGHRDEWLSYDLTTVADREIQDGHISPMIIVLPQGDTWYFANLADDGPRWGEYIDRDLVQEIDTHFRTVRSPAARAIGGLSMGGWAALSHAFQRPDIFGIVGAHSASLRPEDGSLPFLGTGDEWAAKDPLLLAQSLPLQRLQSLQIWIDAAQDDPWLVSSTGLHTILADRGVANNFQAFPGMHEWTYWTEHSIDYLHFYSNAFSSQ